MFALSPMMVMMIMMMRHCPLKADEEAEDLLDHRNKYILAQEVEEVRKECLKKVDLVIDCVERR